MANKIGRTPWIIDTANANSVAPYPVNPVWVTSLVFSGYGTAGAQCVVEDSRGAIVRFVGTVDLEPITVSFPAPQPITGLKVTTLDSGQLSVFLA